MSDGIKEVYDTLVQALEQLQKEIDEKGQNPLENEGFVQLNKKLAEIREKYPELKHDEKF